jgi:hypothetical protein
MMIQTGIASLAEFGGESPEWMCGHREIALPAVDAVA